MPSLINNACPHPLSSFVDKPGRIQKTCNHPQGRDHYYFFRIVGLELSIGCLASNGSAKTVRRNMYATYWQSSIKIQPKANPGSYGKAPCSVIGTYVATLRQGTLSRLVQ